MLQRNRVIIAMVVFLLIGFVIGMWVGSEIVIAKVVKIARPFVEVDSDLMHEAVYRYENHLSCLS